MPKTQKIEENKSELKIAQNMCDILNETTLQKEIDDLKKERSKKKKEVLTFAKMFVEGVKSSDGGAIEPRYSRMLSSIQEIMYELEDNWAAIERNVETLFIETGINKR